ncbi:nocobactin polyketide synthase NbtC [Nocardia testacea]|uniref:nocobactin polyketide synthase NbtC n=1 Tax=Nocardia testacea TaxID=248551 RepID=UPI003C2BAC19
MLTAEARALLGYLEIHPDVPVGRIAEMIFRTRVARRYRALAMVTDTAGLIDALGAVAADSEHPRVVRSGAATAGRGIAFVFPGQGGQRPGMGRLFYDRIPAFRAEATRCDEVFRELFGESPLDYLLDDTAPADDSAHIVQPALFVQMAGLAAAWRSAGVEPAAVLGHSQGEIAAAYVAGLMTLPDAALVVGTRARAVDTISSDAYAMAVIAADRETCEDLLARRSGWAQVSVVNSPHMVALSGERETVAEVVDACTEQGIFARVIRVRYPAHTSMVNEFRDAIHDAVKNRLANQYFASGEIACLGATLGAEITPDLPIGDYWFWNLRNPVRFDRAVAAATTREIGTFVEIAEHPTLQLAIQENLTALGESGARVVGSSHRAATDLREFTRNLAVVAVDEPDFRWAGLRVGTDAPPALPLPDFPHAQMNEVRLWLPGQATAPAAARSAAAPAPRAVRPESDTAPAQLIVERWTRLTRRKMAAPRRLGIIDHTGERAELAARLCAEAAHHGATAQVIDPAHGPDTGDIDTLVVLLPEYPESTAAAAATATAEFFGTRAWWPGLSDRITGCWLVTTGGEAVLDGDPAPHPVAAAASAGFRCAGTEFPGVVFAHLDLEPGAVPAGPVLTALHTAGETELALRDGGLYAKRLYPGEPGAAATTPAHLVITGGTGSLGLRICEHFVRAGTAQITLVSRSGESAEVTAALRPLRQSTTRIRVSACDIGDPAAVARLAAELRDRPADLILHAAADYAGLSELELEAINTDQVRRVLHGKTIGVENLLDSLPRAQDCRIVLFSSLAATLGGRGKIIYAAANRMLDAYAHRARATGSDCVSIQWGQWADYRGQNATDTAQLAAVGYLPMSAADAIALGLSGLRGNAVVAAFDWDRGWSVLDAYGYGPVLSELHTPAPAPVTAAATPAPATDAGPADLGNRVVEVLTEVLGADDSDSLDTSRPLVALGLDSLQALEFRRRIEHEYGYELPVADLLGGATVDTIVADLGGRAQRAPDRSAAARGPEVVRAPVARPAAGSARPTAPAEIAALARRTAEQAVPADLDLDRLRTARRDLDITGLRAMLNTLAPALDDGEFHTAEEIAAAVRFADRHHWLLRRWLDELTGEGCLTYDPVRGYRTAAAPPEPSCSDLRLICADLGYSREFADFLRSSAANLTGLAQDRVRVQELLFPDGDMLTAEAAYRENIISNYLNLAARETVAGVTARIAADRAPVRILELGAGIGGTTDEVIAGLPGLPVDYHFTDLSAFFLNAARERFAGHPWMRYGIVDMNQDLHGTTDRYDIVIGANVLHNALHIGEMLRDLHDLLNPGGAVVFVEACKANYPLLTSMKFLMSAAPGGTHPGKEDIRQGARIFLTEDEWCEQLRVAGFTPLLVLPERDHPMFLLDQRVFAAIRD